MIVKSVRSMASMVTLCLGVLLCGVAGCGGGGLGLATVEGTVLLDGKPVNDATVIFEPEEGGRPSIGKTDVDGHYTLLYIEGTPGALPGKHKVRISTLIEADSESVDPQVQAGREEGIPANYNSETTLSIELNRGEDVMHNFSLQTPEV